MSEGNGDRVSTIPSPPPDVTDLTALPDHPTDAQRALAYANMCVAYHEMCQRWERRFQEIDAKLTLILQTLKLQ